MIFLDKIFSKFFMKTSSGAELEFDKVADHLPDALIIIDRRGTVTSVNLACCKLLGYSREEILGQSASMFFVKHRNDPFCTVEPPTRKEDERFLGRILDELVLSGYVNDLEVVFLTKDCRRIPMNFNGVVLRDGQGEITGVLGLARDMRQIKQNIRKLDLLKTILLLSLERISVEKMLERVGRLVKDFLSAQRITFFISEGDTLKSAYASDMASDITLEIGKGIAGYVARTGKPYRTNDAPSDPNFCPEIDAATGYKTRRILAVPVIDSSKLFGVVEALDKNTDFTDEDAADFEEVVNLAKFVVFDKIKEVKLAHSEEKYRELVESISDVIYSMDASGIITYASSAINALLGCSPSSVVGAHYTEMLHPADVAAAEAAFADCFNGKQYPLECRVKSADGNYRWVRTLGKIYHVDGKPAGVRATLSDITDRKNVEDDLNKRVTYEKMLAKISAAAVASENTGEFLNGALALICSALDVCRGYICTHRAETDTMDNTHEWCAPGILPQKDIMQGIPSSAMPSWTEKLRKKQIIKFSDIEDISLESEKSILRVKGTKSALVFPIFVNSEYFGFIGFDECVNTRQWQSRDVDMLGTATQIISWAYERARMEKDRTRLYLQMLQSAKMASVGDLAAGLAHEIGNPLQTILGNAELLLAEEKRDESEAIKNAALHAKKIIENLMNFSRQHEMKFVADDVNLVLSKTLSLYGRQLELSGIKVERHFTKLPKALVLSSHLAQVFLNIITNARKAMPSGGTLAISTAAYPPNRPEHINVTFKDNGIGVEPSALKKIFDPFFTTKKDGVGLGLSVSYGIVKQHGGNITFHSEGLGKGSEVTITIPVNRPQSGDNGFNEGK